MPKKARVYKTKSVPGLFEFSKPTWVMTDGWITAVCGSWDDAMRKARRRMRGQAL